MTKLLRSNRTNGNGNDAGCEHLLAQDMSDAGFNADWTGGQSAYALPNWNSERYFPDVTIFSEIKPTVISVKMQQVRGSADQKVAEEVCNLLHLLRSAVVEKAILVLAGRGWRRSVDATKAYVIESFVGGKEALDAKRLNIVHIDTEFKCMWCDGQWTDKQRVRAGKCLRSKRANHTHSIKVSKIDSSPVVNLLTAQP